MNANFVATAGSSLDTPVYSGECTIATALTIVTRQNYDKTAGLNPNNQKGVNRSWDRKRSRHIAKGSEHRLSTKQPLEHGAVILIDPQKQVKSTPVASGSSAVVLTIPDGVKLPFIDRQHTVGGLEISIAEPQTFPLLNAYVNDPNNTLTVKIIQCDEREGRKRFEILNFQPKQLSPVEKMWATTINALDYEELSEPAAYRDSLPVVVSFMAWHELADDPNSIWHERLIVDSSVTRPPPKKNAIPIKTLVDETTVIYRMFEHLDPDFSKLCITDQSKMIREALSAFWKSISSNLPEATGDKWFNYLVLKRGARLLMKIMAALLRVYKERRGKKNIKPEEAFMSQVSLQDFCINSIPNEYIAKVISEGESSFSDDNYWNDANQRGFVLDGDEKALVYMWKKMNVHNSGKWSQHVNSANTNEWQNTIRDRLRASASAEVEEIEK